MKEPVKRAYSSDRRRQQAELTRGAILRAAQTLFVANGYNATTIQSVADEAGVAVQTVYAVFKNKRQLLDQLTEAAIVGGADTNADITHTAEVDAIAAEPDPRRRAEMDAAMTRAIAERVGPIVRVAQEAAASDPEFAVVFDAMRARRREEMSEMVKVLGAQSPLRMNSQQAAATLYVLYSPMVADMLMGDFGLSPAKYEKWLADMLYFSLLEAPPAD